MHIDEAKRILNSCVREECRDHAFGDREIYWMQNGKERAFSYMGGGTSPFVSIYDEEDENKTIATFDDREALELLNCGSDVIIGRNDETGPDSYRDGNCMPGLTLEGVRKEICKP